MSICPDQVCTSFHAVRTVTLPPSLRPEKDTEDPGQGTKFKVLGLVLGEDFDSENWRPFFVHDVLEQPEKERHGHLKRSYHGL